MTHEVDMKPRFFHNPPAREAQVAIHAPAADVRVIERAVIAGGGVTVPLREASSLIVSAECSDSARALLGGRLEWMHVWNGEAPAWLCDMLDDEVSVGTSWSQILDDRLAEECLAAVLACARLLGSVTRTRHWCPRDVNSVAGITVGIIARSGPARSLTARLNDLGAHVVVVPVDTPVGRTGAASGNAITPAQFAAVLGASEYLVCGIPRSLGASIPWDGCLRRLRRGGWLIDIGGSVAAAGVVAKAVRSGLLSGAFIDVLESDPIAWNPCLTSLEHVVVACRSEAELRGATRRVAVIVENIERFRCHHALIGRLQRTDRAERAECERRGSG